MRRTSVHPAGGVMLAVWGRTPIAAIITSSNAVPAGLPTVSVPVDVAAEVALRKLIPPKIAAEVAARNSGLADMLPLVAPRNDGCAVAGAAATESASPTSIPRFRHILVFIV